MNKVYKEFKDIIESNEELKEALQKPRVLILEVKSGENKGTYIGPEARKVKREIGWGTKFNMYSEDMSEYWARELIALYM